MKFNKDKYKIEDLKVFDDKICEIAKKYNLDWYPINYEIVNDCRVLKALKNRNYIKSYSKTHKYIDEHDFMLTSFKYNNNDYVIKYFDGCFMPFVCKINNN